MLRHPRLRPWLILVLIALLAGGTGFGAAGAQAPPPQDPAATVEEEPAPDVVLTPSRADYDLEVRLDPTSKTLDGSQLLTWHNATPSPTRELRFHLYYNAWRNTESTWFRESVLGPERRRRNFAEIQPEDWGYCDVESVRLVGEEFGELELIGEAWFDAPDDGNPHDRTVFVVPLPESVEPGATVQVALKWKAKVPRTFARTGYRGDFFFLAHWFPKLGVLEPDGTWNCHQFHTATEFFADYGNYDVKITVPTGFTVGASGREVEVRANPDQTSTHHYRESDIHGFAWTTSPDYLEARRRFEAPGLPAVDMRLLYQPEHRSQVERHFRATAAALRYYGTWYGAYTYPQVTVVDPAFGSAAGGMEYPTLFTCGTRYLNPEGGGSPEGVTIHEAGHQFWYGMVGSNEFEDAWLDEGLNTFSTARVQDVEYGPRFYVERFFRGFFPVMERGILLDRAVAGNRLDRYRRSARRDVPATPTYLYYPRSAADISYSKTAVWLATLERTLGWETLREILGTFFTRYKFRHPKPEDFFAVANEVAQEDLTPFFDQVFRSAALFDYSVDSVSSKVYHPRGLLDEGTPASSGGTTSPRVLAVPSAPATDGADAGEGTLYETRVVVRRLEDGVLPVEVLLRFEDGEEVREVWDGQELWKLYRLVRPTRLELAVVDPERKLLLDLDYTNNTKLVEGRSSLPASKWASKWMVWLQDYVQTLSFFM